MRMSKMVIEWFDLGLGIIAMVVCFWCGLYCGYKDDKANPCIVIAHVILAGSIFLVSAIRVQ